MCLALQCREKFLKSPAGAALSALNAHLTSNTYLLGDAVSDADVAVAGLLYEVFSLILTRHGGDVGYESARRWFDGLLHLTGLTEIAKRCGAVRGGVAREGGQIDLRPVPSVVSRHADDSIARNFKAKKHGGSQRDVEKAKKAATTSTTGASASASAEVAAAPSSVAATATQPASNTGPPLSCEEAITKTMEALAGAGIDTSGIVVHRHPATPTMEDMERECGGLDGVLCKNLFLKVSGTVASPH
jgi:hypothetical protein